MSRPYAGVEVGDSVGELVVAFDRAGLVCYAGAALDFNPIHWSDLAADRSGLPGVIAHGMLTMAVAGRLATDWAGDPGAVRDFAARFSAVVPVPADGAAEVRVSGRVEEKLGDGRVAVALLVESGEREVLKGARVVLELGG